MPKTKRLFLLLSVFALLALFQTSALAKDEWVRVRSKNFHLIGNAPEKDVRKVAVRLEQFRETFRLLFAQIKLSAAIPTNVVVFKSASSYNQFKPKRGDGKIDKNIAGYFQPGEDVNYITLSTEGEDAATYGTIFHEYVHFMVDTTFGKSDVPPWFNEGLAEYYQTFTIEEDRQVKLGLPQSDHLYLLQQTKLIPLETLFKIDNRSLRQNGNHSRNIFYAQAWALIHYLVQTNKNQGLGKFLDAVIKNTPPERAFQDAFQMNYAQMEKELKKYVAQSSYKYHLVTLKDKLVFDAEMQSAPLSEAESNAYLGDLLYHTNRAEDAEPFLQRAVQLEPNLSLANTTFGMVKIRARQYAEAKSYLEKAMADDQKNHFALYQYAYLLSRESYDDFGYVSSFPAEKAGKMRELLKKAIGLNPSFAESYELYAFVSLVNNDQLDEAVAYLRRALQYQPGNQRYNLRIAEIYSRQNKFNEARTLAEKIAATADEPQTKTRAESLLNNIRRQQDFAAQNEKSRREYEAAIAEARKNGDRLVFVEGNRAAPPDAAEIAKINEEAQMRAVNEAVRKPAPGEKQIIGRIQNIECKGKNISYSVVSNGETFQLASKDFQNLALTALVADAGDAQVACGAKNLAALNAVISYKPHADGKTNGRGELTAIDFVPPSFRFVDLSKPPQFAAIASGVATAAARNQTENAPPVASENAETARREAQMRNLRNALRAPQAGEKRQLGYIEKIDCDNKGLTLHFKTATQIVKLTSVSPQTIQIRAFAPEAASVQFGCGHKQLDVPVVFTYKETTDGKKSNGEVVALEFVPKSFRLEE